MVLVERGQVYSPFITAIVMVPSCEWCCERWVSRWIDDRRFRCDPVDGYSAVKLVVSPEHTANRSRYYTGGKITSCSKYKEWEEVELFLLLWSDIKRSCIPRTIPEHWNSWSEADLCIQRPLWGLRGRVEKWKCEAVPVYKHWRWGIQVQSGD